MSVDLDLLRARRRRAETWEGREALQVELEVEQAERKAESNGRVTSGEPNPAEGPPRDVIKAETSPRDDLTLSATYISGGGPTSLGEGNGRPTSLGEVHLTAARFRWLGIPSPSELKPFPCVLVGHDHDAEVFFHQQGHWRYRCLGLKQSVGMGDVRGIIAYGRAQARALIAFDEDRRSPLKGESLPTLQACRWLERLDWDAGVREPVPLDLRLPSKCPPNATAVAIWMGLLVGLRDAKWAITESFTFAKHFAPAYCQMTRDAVRAGMRWLEDNALLFRVSDKGEAPIKWQLAGQRDG